MHRDVLLIFSFQIINNCKRIRNINSTLKLWYSTTQVLGFIIFAAAKLLQPLICLMVILWACKITLKITYNGFIWIFEQSSEYSLFLPQTVLKWQRSWSQSTLVWATWPVSPVLSQPIPRLMWGKLWEDISKEYSVKKSHQQHKSMIKWLSFRWYRKSLLLENDNNFLIESKGTLHTFIIQKVKREHFGEYKCSASNSLGREKADVELTGRNSIKSAVWLSWEIKSTTDVWAIQFIWIPWLNKFNIFELLGT